MDMRTAENNIDRRDIARVIRTIERAVVKNPSTALMEVAAVPESAFHVLISCLISLRTRDAVTAAASKRLYAVAKTPRAIAALPVGRIAKLIYPCAFYRTKAKRIKAIAQRIHARGDAVPDTMDDLLALKGVGRKTANIVMVYGHGKKYHIPVDTHVHRVPNRLGWVDTKHPEQTERALMAIVPKRYWQRLNDVFVSFGQTVCTPVRPKCDDCPVTAYCRYYETVYARDSKL